MIFDTNLLIDLTKNRRKAKLKAEQIRAEQNKLGKEIAKAENEEKEKSLEKAADLSESFKSLSENAEKQEKLFRFMDKNSKYCRPFFSSW